MKLLDLLADKLEDRREARRRIPDAKPTKGPIYPYVPLPRKLVYQPNLDHPRIAGEYPKDATERAGVGPDDANLVSSALPDGRHAPVLDLDVPAKMIPSSTEGHHHLYIDVPMTWRKYKKLLRTLGKVGILEPGYVGASISRGRSHARLRPYPNDTTAGDLRRLANRARRDRTPPVAGAHTVGFPF